MSGHSKWSKVKHRKAVVDVRKGKLVSKSLREIEVAAKLGGGSPEGNPRLKTAIAAARSVSVPSDNIERAIKRGSGEQDSANYEEIVYEGYGAGGVAFMVRALTDNRNRTAADVRSAFNRHGGSLGQSNSVSFLFKEQGVIAVQRAAASEDLLLSAVLEAGAEDVSEQEEGFEITTQPFDYHSVVRALEEHKIEFEGSVQMVPLTSVHITGLDARAVLKLANALEDLDDVQNVYANFDIDESELEQIESGK